MSTHLWNQLLLFVVSNIPRFTIWLPYGYHCVVLCNNDGGVFPVEAVSARLTVNSFRFISAISLRKAEIVSLLLLVDIVIPISRLVRVNTLTSLRVNNL